MADEQGDFSDPQIPRDVMDKFREMVSKGKIREADLFIFGYKREVARAIGDMVAEGDTKGMKRIYDANLGILISRSMLIDECTRGLRDLIRGAYGHEGHDEDTLKEAEEIAFGMADGIEIPLQKIINEIRSIKDSIDDALSWDVVMKEALDRYHKVTSTDPDYMRKAKGNLEYGLSMLEVGLSAIHKSNELIKQGDRMMEEGHGSKGRKTLSRARRERSRGKREIREGIHYLDKASHMLSGATDASEHHIGLSIRRLLRTNENPGTLLNKVSDTLSELRRHRESRRIKH